MNIYMFAEHDELYDIKEALLNELGEWAKPKTTVTIIERGDESTDDPKTKRSSEVGIELTVGKVQKLKDPLNSLYQMSKTHQCDFVVGVIEDGKYSDVCYFGHQEGRPDMYEIANYLGFD